MADVCEEEDLETLRLAALQTLKKKSSSEQVVEEPSRRNEQRNQYGRFRRKNRLGLRGKPHRPVSSNLIPLTSNTETPPFKRRAEPRQISKNTSTKDTSDSVTSKFDRYKDTDESENEDSEDELLKGSDDEEEGKLVKSDSLEALMQELDEEILGKPEVEVSTSKEEPVEVIKVEVPPEPKKSLPPVHRRQFKPNRNKRPAFQPRPMLPFMPINPEPLPLPIMMGGPPVGPLFHDSMLTPLLIDAEALRTQTLAPLSPRSAAFVLENRAIIEKRKRSPRRSYSRSLSPWERDDYRKRSPSPVRRPIGRKYSVSPRPRPQKSGSVSPRRRSPSPRRRVPVSPNRRSLSPKKRSPSPRASRKDLVKPSIHKRLGFKLGQKREDRDESQNDKPVDPVLEARKKKFESSEVTIREGVIKLKLKKSEDSINSSNSEPIDAQNTVDDDIDLEYSRLSPELDELEDDVEIVAKNLVSQPRDEKIDDLDGSTKLSLKRPRLKLKTSTGSRIKKRKTSKKESKMFDKRIEIRIKNPTKYMSDEEKMDASVSKPIVNIEDSEDDTAIIIENDEDGAENENISTKESDLRTQLSRKRAQKHSKTLTPPDVVPSRLLKNALQNVLPLEKRKKSKEKNNVTNDGKLPIHMRLGLSDKRKERNLSRK